MTDLIQHKWVRVLTWTAVTLVTLYGLLCTCVNFTGARMLRDAQAKLAAVGETTDFRAITNEPVPDERNFCAIPALKDIALLIEDQPDKGESGAKRKRLEAMKFPADSKAGERPRLGSGATFGTRVELNAWRDWLRKAGLAKSDAATDDAARDVLAALSPHDVLVTELAAGLDLPAAQWTPPWRTRELPPLLFAVTLPHYSALQGVSQNLALRAAAAARAGDAVKAHESLRIMARLNEANLNEPFLIGTLVAAAGTSHFSGGVWEVCDAHCGSAADYAKLEGALSALDFKRATLLAWRGELAGGVTAMDYFNTTRDGSLLSIITSDGKTLPPPIGPVLLHLIPAGMFDGNTAVIIDHECGYLIEPLRGQGWKRVMESAAAFDSRLQEERKEIWRHPFHLMASLTAPAMNSVTQRVVHTQCLLDQAMVACALERHRIEHGAYPDSLDGIKLANGRPLPLDLLSEKPMGYHKTADEKYVLWCVGFDLVDDGGKRVLDAKKPEQTRFSERAYKGDWVWNFPAAQ